MIVQSSLTPAAAAVKVAAQPEPAPDSTAAPEDSIHTAPSGTQVLTAVGLSAGNLALAGAVTGLLASGTTAFFDIERFSWETMNLAHNVAQLMIPAAGAIFGWLQYGPTMERFGLDGLDRAMHLPVSRLAGAALGAGMMSLLVHPGGVGTDYGFFAFRGAVHGAAYGALAFGLEPGLTARLETAPAVAAVVPPERDALAGRADKD
ncbi:MAG: hypothetical protein HY319_11990 [Armatimonadetes bacterium]|nr:hypothetical protein [Armatimonadota bacterium]